MMDNAVKERLVGAAVLVLLVVIVVPALLSGPRDSAAPATAADAGEGPAVPASEVRVVEIDLTGKQGQAAATTVLDPVENPAVLPAPGQETAAADAAGGVTAQVAESAAPLEEAPTQPAAAPAPSAGGWAVQVAALSSGEAAAKLAAELKGKGYSAFVLEYRADGKVFYRVRVGPEPQRERAEALAARLLGEGLKPTVVAHP